MLRLAIALVITACVAEPGGRVSEPEVAAGSRGFAIVWTDYVQDSAGDPPTKARAMLRFATADGARGAERAICTYSGGDTRSPAVAWTGTDWLATCALDLIRLDPTGVARGSTSLPLAGTTGLLDIACSATTCLVVRQQAPSGVVGVRVDHNGKLLDAAPIPITGIGGFKPRVAYAGSAFWVVWWESGPDDLGSIRGTRIDDTGALLDHAAIPIEPAAGTIGEGPAIGCLSGTCLVAYGGAPPAIRRVDASGAVLDAQPTRFARPGMFGCESDRTRIGGDGSELIVGWGCSTSTNRGALATRVSVGGDVRDPTAIVVSDAAMDQFAPAIAGVDGTFFAAWEDGRSHSDVYGARVTGTGAVLDRDGILLGSPGD